MAHPVSGGAYADGRAELGPVPGFLAGVLFLVGKTASVAAIVLLLRLGATGLAASASPLADAVGPGAATAIRAVAAIACLGSLLSVLAGLSRTALAMARDGELPARLSGISERTATRLLAELVVRWPASPQCWCSGAGAATFGVAWRHDRLSRDALVGRLAAGVAVSNEGVERTGQPALESFYTVSDLAAASVGVARLGVAELTTALGMPRPGVGDILT